MIRRPLGWLASALTVCAILGGLTASARADIITYTAELTPSSVTLMPGAGVTMISLGTLGPQYLLEGSGSPVSIPLDRVITAARILGSWTSPPQAMAYPSAYEMRADGVTIPESVPQPNQPVFSWQHDLVGDLESLRSTGIAMSIRLVGQPQISGIGVGTTRLEITTVPEPASLVLWSVVGATCLGALYLRRRRIATA